MASLRAAVRPPVFVQGRNLRLVVIEAFGMVVGCCADSGSSGPNDRRDQIAKVLRDRNAPARHSEARHR